jgi:lysophospholipase L1-like esterase
MATALAACSSKPKSGDGADAGGAASNGKPASGSKGASASGGSSNGSMPASIAMVGDSITALSKDAIEAVLKDMGFAVVTVNAEPSRRIEIGSKKPMPGLDVIRYIQASTPPAMWVIALGTNDAGLYSTDDEYQTLIDDVLAAIPTKVPLVWVSTYRKDQLKGCEQFNLLMRKALKDRGNAVVAEWYQQVAKTKGAILTQDGVHPNADGILVFADTVRAGITSELS